MTPWMRPFATGVNVTVKARPNSRRPGPPQLVPQADGSPVLEVAVAAPAVDGRANDAILDRLSDWWGLPAGRLRLKMGATGRLKVVEISGNPAEITARLTAWATAMGLQS